MNRRHIMRQLILLMPISLATGCDKPAGSGDGVSTPIVVANDAPSVKKASGEPTPAMPLAAGGVFRFSDDEGGKILSKILPPAANAPLGAPKAKEQSERPVPISIAQPDVPARANAQALPQVPTPPQVGPRPSPLPDLVPLELARKIPVLPERILFRVGPLTKQETPDVKQPSPLPILAAPSKDRAPLDDPTVDFTAQSILNNKLPLRETTAPFVKVNLPDPFENAEAAKVKIALKEDALTVIGNPPPPKP
jgi:hypothetical protein